MQARAVFYPLLGSGSAVNMCYRTLYIGTGKGWFLCTAGRCGEEEAGEETLRSRCPSAGIPGASSAPQLWEITLVRFTSKKRRREGRKA